jgi:hypothetical protein
MDAKARYRARRQALKSRVHALKLAPCFDCGRLYHPTIMEYDHRPGTQKIACVSDLTRHIGSWQDIEEEIAKCDLVCANCHRLRSTLRDPNRCLCPSCVVLSRVEIDPQGKLAAQTVRDSTKRLSDGNNLYLVSTATCRSWRIKFRLGGKERTFTLGRYPQMTLEEARRQRDLAFVLIKQGLDPVAAKRLTRRG